VFSGTITSNVAYGDRRSKNVEEDVRKAVAVAQARSPWRTWWAATAQP